MMESLYVCLFSNGHVKVGRSIDPTSRIASHADRVACMGVELAGSYTVECCGDSEPRETILITRCADACSQRFKSEWFAGLDFEAVKVWARDAARMTDVQPVSRLRLIRERLGMTQTELALAIGCTQGNIGHYERGQMLLPDRAIRLVDFAATRGLELTLDQIYGRDPLPTLGGGVRVHA